MVGQLDSISSDSQKDEKTTIGDLRKLSQMSNERMELYNKTRALRKNAVDDIKYLSWVDGYKMNAAVD